LDCFDFFNVYHLGGVNLNNIWVYLGGFLSVVAIELFAVWSILSNIISGIFIFIMNPFKTGSKIKLYDPEVQATVVNINLMFTELEDDDGIFNVPNNTFFQKTVKGINAEKTQPN
jgi:small-conductance mechanosensitive channel